MIKLLIPLQQAGTAETKFVGGKAAALGRLIAYNAPVPPGFVIDPSIDLKSAKSQIYAAFDVLKVPFVAVRSSAVGEDGQDQSWAGQFESYLYVQRSGLLDRIEDCRRSGASNRAQAYNDTAHRTMPVAVIVQTMVASDIAGVLFTANPVTKDRDEIMIEAIYGLGELLVQGLATPDNYLVKRSTGEIVAQTITEKAVMLVGQSGGVDEQPVPKGSQNKSALTPAQLDELTQLAVRLESKFAHPLDIEWAYARNKLYILQARPITTL